MAIKDKVSDWFSANTPHIFSRTQIVVAIVTAFVLGMMSGGALAQTVEQDVRLSWDASPGATEYRIYDGFGGHLRTVADTDHTFRAVAVTVNVALCYRVTAVNSHGESAPAEGCAVLDGVAPITPVNLNVEFL